MSWPAGRGQETMWAACRSGDLALVKELLGSKEVSIDKVCPKTGMSSLLLAVKHGWTDVVQVLADAAARHDVVIAPAEGNRFVEGYTAMHLAAILSGRADCLAILLRTGPLHHRGPNGWTPLHCAAFAGRYDAIRYLLEADADTDTQADDGKTPLMMASSTGMTRSVRLLLGVAANLDIRDADGSTALHCALDTKTQRVLAGKMPLRVDNYHCAYLLAVAGVGVRTATATGVGALDYLSPAWRLFYETVSKYRTELLRGGTLPFTEARPLKISEDRVPSGVCFDELLAADLNTLLALGLSDDDAQALREALHTVWAEVSRLRSGALDRVEGTEGSVRRRKRVAPLTTAASSKLSFPVAAVRRFASSSNAAVAAVCVVFLLLAFAAGLLVERYKDDSFLLYAATMLFPDPFAEQAADPEE
ncbi:Delta-latroinsectotoxin-Lt1a [Diplonema papillatum]|nr:Delta-latroinsectotoxin-Lt1a [Diplonema papillatum]